MPLTQDLLLAGARAPIDIYKPSIGAEGAGTWSSLWTANGRPAAGATPTAFGTGATVPDNTTTGGLGQADPSGANKLYMIAASFQGTVAGTLILYDRLWSCSGFATNTTSTQTVTSPPSIPTGRLRDGSADYSDIEAWLEVYTAPGATTATWTVVCPDGGNTSRSYTYTHPANAETVGQMMPLTVPAGAAAGFRPGGTMSLTCSVSSGTAGNIGLTFGRRLATIGLPLVNLETFKGALDLALAEVKTDACLAMMLQCSTTSTGIIVGQVGLSEADPA